MKVTTNPYKCDSLVSKSKVVPLHILIALLHLEQLITELLLRAELIRALLMCEYVTSP